MPVVDEKYWRTPGIELSIVDDVLTFRMLFIRGFLLRFGWLIAMMIPLLILLPYLGVISTGGLGIVPNLGPLLYRRLLDILPFIGIVAGCDAFLWVIFETMLLRGTFRFDRAAGRFWAGLWRYPTQGLTYVAVRRQISKTKTWTRWCFYLGFDHDAGPAFDRFNPLHRLVAIYGEARRNEYYLGYITGQETAERVGSTIARFMSVNFRADVE